MNCGVAAIKILKVSESVSFKFKYRSKTGVSHVTDNCI